MREDLVRWGLLLFVSALVAMLTRRLRLPYTVGLLLAGVALYFSPFRAGFPLSRDLIYFVFLPPLVFEAALYMRWPEFKRNLPVVALLATVGLALAAIVTTVGMHAVAGWPWGTAALFGTLIAATDPVSVIATFKDAGVHGRLRVLVEAESLLNDGTAAVAFTIAAALATGAHAGLASVAGEFAWTIGAGVACGAAVAVAMLALAGRTRDHLVQITISTLTAYGAFMLAEQLHASGVIAALTAGLVAGNARADSREAAERRVAVESFWEYVGFVVNSLVFLLIGAHEAQLRFAGVWPALLAAVAFVTLGRALAIYPPCALFARTGLRVERTHQHVLFWGGLRGALALALALELPTTLPEREAVVTVTFAVVAFSIVVQGLTMTPLLRRLGELDEVALPPFERLS